MRSTCPKNVHYAGLTLVSESRESLKGKLKTCKGGLESKGLGVNINTKMIMRKLQMSGKMGKFPFAVYGKVVSSTSITYQFCRFWVQKKCSGFRDRRKQDDECKCRTQASQEIDTVDQCLNVQSNGQSLEVVEMFCYLGDTIRARRGPVDSVLTRNG